MHIHTLSDKDLVHQYIGGQELALATLIERHKDRVYSYLCMIVKNRALADDLFQDVFIKVINTLKVGKYNEEGKFLPWVMRIAHNLAIDHFRAQKRMPTTSGSEDFDIFDIIGECDESIEDKMMVQQTHELLKVMIEELPEEQKSVLKMRHYFKMSFKEIAEDTGVSINTALGRMRYALINLRKMMEEKNISLAVN